MAKGAELLASHHGAASMPPKKQMPTVQCKRRGCTGCCPAFVVIRGYKRDGVKATCFVCDQPYDKPSAAVVAMVEEAQSAATTKKGRVPQPKAAVVPKAGAPATEKKLQEEVRRLKAELQAAKASNSDTVGQPTGEVEPRPASSEQERADAELSKAKETLRRLENSLEDMRALFKKPFDQMVAEQKAEVQQLDAKRRGLRPVDDQLKQSRLRLAQMQERHSRETKTAEATEEEIAKLQAKLLAQHNRASALAEDIEKAKLEISQLSMAAAAEVTGATEARNNPTAATSAASLVTATAVRTFFGALPQTVADHPEGQEAIKTVMQMLEKLDQAAKVEEAACLPAQGEVQQAVQAMELDEDHLSSLAEAVVPTTDSDDSEEGKEIRKSKVAEAKASLKSVKKTAVKK